MQQSVLQSCLQQLSERARYTQQSQLNQRQRDASFCLCTFVVKRAVCGLSRGAVSWRIQGAYRHTTAYMCVRTRTK